MKNKLFKRSISVALVVLTLFAMMAFGFTANAAVQQYNIDTTKKASLTLYKYEMADVAAATTGGTGEQTDRTSLPEGATPLKGVTFTVYKVAELDNYFTKDGASLPTAEEAEKMIKSSTPKKTGVTNDSGLVKFSNLPLGIYYVKETDGPAQVTKPIAPFVLSLPLTDKTGSKWLYDVYSFPKNETAYGDVSVKKLDSVTGKPLEGAEFTLYDSKDGQNYTEYQTNITTGSNGVAEIKSLPAQKYYKFVETKTSDASYILDSTVGYEFYVDATGDMIIDGKAVDNNTIVVGNEAPQIHKYILDGKKGAEGIDNTANYGDTVYWKIKTDIPTTVGKLKTYNVVDTMSTGIEYKDSEVFLDDTKQLKEGTDYTVKAEGLTVTYTFKPTALVDYKQVIIYFNTTLTTKAPLAKDIPNTSELIYTNKVGTDSTYEKPSETPTVHTGGLQFKKTDGSKPLDNVEFKIYATEEDAKANKNAIKTAKSDSNGLVTFKGLAYGSFSADAEGKAANGVNGGSRDYWVVETKGKAGYSLISAPFKMTVNNKSHIAANNDEVVNNPVPELPPTGGAGTTVLFVVSGLMVGFGLLLFIRRKKADK